MSGVWPPTLADAKDDLAIPADDAADDAAVQRRLDAAAAFVQRVRSDAFELGDDGHPVEPVVFSARGEREAGSLILGALMLTAYLFARRRSPDTVLWMAETGTTRVPGDDPAIRRMLKLHRPKVG